MAVGPSRLIGGAHVVLTLNSRPFYAGLAQARNSLGTFGTGRALGGLQQAFGRLTVSVKALSVLGGGLAAAFTLKFAVDEAVRMERQLNRLRRTLGTTAEETAKFSRSFFSMASTLAGPALDHIVELSIMASRLGVQRQHLDLFTRDLAKVSAVLEEIPIEDAATRISGLNDIFGLAQTNAIRWASALNQLDIQSNASAADILNISNRMAGAASTIGLTAQQTLALSTALRQARVPIETAGTAMSQILGRMTSTRDLGNFARTAGLTADAFRKILESDPLEAFLAVERGLSRLSAIERFRALDRLHLDGQRVRLVMLQMIPLIDRIGEFTGIANREWSGLGSITKQFNLQAQTASAMLTRMWNNVKLLAVGAGTFLLPVVKSLTEAVSFLSTDMAEMFRVNESYWKGAGRGLGGFLELIGTLRTNWLDWATLFQRMRIDFFNQIVENGRWAFETTFRIAINIGRRLFPGLENYITGLVNTLQTALIGIQNTIAAVFNNLRSLGSMPGVGNIPMLGPLFRGLASMTKIPVAAAVDLSGRARGAMDPRELARDAMKGVAPPPGIRNPFRDPDSFSGAAWGRIKGTLEGFRERRGMDQAKATLKDFFTRLIVDAASEKPAPEARKAAARVLAGEQAAGLPGFAAGGRPRPGRPAIVGERGPEVFVPDRPGRVIPMDEAREMLMQIQMGRRGFASAPERVSPSMAAARQALADQQLLGDRARPRESFEMFNAKAMLGHIPIEDAATGARPGTTSAPVGWSRQRAVGATLGLMGGLPGLAGAAIGIGAGSGARARRLELEAWRARMAARSGRGARQPGPLEIRRAMIARQLAARRAAILSRPGAVAAAQRRLRRQEVLARHHAPTESSGAQPGKDVFEVLTAIRELLEKKAVAVWQ